MKKKHILGLFAFAAIVTGFIYFGSSVSAQKSDSPEKSPRSVPLTNTPQTLPFSQNWTTTTLITVDDSWSGVPGIVGYRGDDLSTVIGADLQTVLADGSATPVDVNANRSDPDVFNTGGLTEFDGIPNPVVAFQGSGTSDVPHLVIHLNTTGLSNIQVSYNARDIDNGVGIDAIQQVNTQFRVGGTGDYANVTGGYIADASAPGGATLVTPVNVTLPAAANNQALVEVRIMTINALGSDEFIGIDDISVTGSGAPADTFGDFNGDGKSDWNVVRNTGGGPSGQITWFTQINGSATTTATPWGINGDAFIPEDYDGDGKDDIAVWRGDPTLAYFYILQSSTSTFRAEQFGITGDNVRVAGDYDGDGKTDVAVFRANGGATIPDPCGVGKSIWYYRPSGTPGVSFRYECWGKNGDFPAPGDYDGDGKNDYVVQQATGIGNSAVFQLKKSAGGIEQVYWGNDSDQIVQGDYDGDGKTDFCTVRPSSGTLIWNILERDGGGTGASPITWGIVATDFLIAGDFDGDGKADITVWRPNPAAGQTFFYVRRSSDAGLTAFQWGQQGDAPVNYAFVN